MAKALVGYYSKTGNTEKMAIMIAEAVSAAGLPVDLRKAADIGPDDLLAYDLIILGSPVYYGSMAWPVKKLLDESVKHHGKLKGRVGGAFCSSGNLAGGNETAVLDILNALLIHGMIVQGDHQGDHYGPAAVGRQDERATRSCAKYGKRLAQLTLKLAG
jgi:NAD(P)H dehydrogenase (quinone)